ncbi:serpin family protein [Eubacterium sp.]|uniref:serpin family protein n=1 Tax=Eubacterium sp. TaxID=142586 RepID=UPI0025CD3943|nr:serpin family protein [Eubacterium sp.]MCR5629723.1 serpin family protein [Eubacterium sp.]
MRKKSLLLNAMLISALLAGSCGSKTITKTTIEPTTITSEPSTSGNANSNAGKPVKTEPTKIKKVKNAFAPKNMASSFDNLFLNALPDKAEDDNVLISPFSVIMDFGMLENGAKGATLDELEKYLNGGMPLSELNKLMETMRTSMMKNKDVNWNVANAIWLNKKQTSGLNKDFQKTVKDIYNSEVNIVPYSNATVDEINNWVNKETSGMIPKLLDKVSSEELMHLINAIAFKGDWEEEFEKDNTEKDTIFNNLDGTTSKVNMMHCDLNSYIKTDDLLGFTKNFKGGKYKFFALQSNKDLTPKEIMEKIKKDGTSVSDIIYQNTVDAPAYIGLPKFSIDYGIQLNGVLNNMGICKSFGLDADFSGLCDGKSPYINQVIHKTHFEVSETGVKAAAATSISMNEACIIDEPTPVTINMDKPFVYGILDEESKLPVFIGEMHTFAGQE